jgi:hypothetical protein
LVDDDWHARIADFGLAGHADTFATEYSSVVGGSTQWMVPELFDPVKEPRRKLACDFHALGCVYLEVTGNAAVIYF